MKARVLPIINAIGCLVLIGLIATQWRKEHACLIDISLLQSKLTVVQDHATEEEKHSAALEKDIAALKETIEIIRKSNEESTRILAEQNNHTGNLQEERDAARAQIKIWEISIAERDDKLRNLNTDLTATRYRLNEAISKLKAAGAH